LGPLRRDQRDAGDAGALLLDLRDTADGEVIDELLVELLALGHVVEGLREQLLRVDVGQPALACLAAATRRAESVVDENISHRKPPGRCPGGWTDASEHATEERRLVLELGQRFAARAGHPALRI